MAYKYTRRAVRGIMAVGISSVLAVFIAYITRIVLARNLSPHDYGFFYSIFTVITFFIFIQQLGLGRALIKFISEFKAKKQYDKIKTSIVSSFTFMFLAAVIISGIFLLLSSYLAENYFRDPLAAKVLSILVLYILFNSFLVIVNASLQGLQRMTIYSFIGPTKNLVVLLLILLFFSLGKGLFSPVFAYVLMFPITFLIFLPFVLKYFPFFKYKVKNFKSTSKKLLLFGLPLLLSGFGSKIIADSDTLMLTFFRTFEEVGIYNVVLPSALVFLFFSSSISAVLFPMVSELWTKKDKKRLQGALKFLYKYTFAALTPLMLSVFVFASLFIKIFFGSEYVAGAPAFQILLIGVLFFILASVNNTVLAGIGKPVLVIKIISFVAVLNIILNFILIPSLGIVGAALATAVSYLIILILSILTIIKSIDLHIPGMDWLKTLLASFIFLFLAFIIKKILVLNIWLELIIVLLISGLIYLLILYLLKVINIKEIKNIVVQSIK